METMLIGLVIVGAVVAVSTLNVPVSHTEGYKVTQERVVQDALDSLYAQPSHDTSRAIFGSLLEEYILKAIAGEPAALMSYLNRTLPAGAQYNVYVDNGYGRSIPVIDAGQPVGEAVAGARSFVPRLAYIFMVPEFAVYQHDFHMNVLAIPMHNSILQRDEGEPVELAVTVVGENGEPVTIRTYGHTALRMNDPDARSWPGLSLFSLERQGHPCWLQASTDGSFPAACRSHRYDASDAPLYGSLDENLVAIPDRLVGGSGPGPIFGEPYNITFPVVLREEAGHNVPRGATISLDFPRGWIFNDVKRRWVERENSEHWQDFQWTGTEGVGWKVSAVLKQPFKNTEVVFMMSGTYIMLADTAYPHFHPIVVQMGRGVQGQMTLLLDTPQALDAGSFRHESYLSASKPLISGAWATWGMGFANLGQPGGWLTAGMESGIPTGRLQVLSVELRQPQGLPVFTDVTHLGGWAPGVWDEVGRGHFIWTPAAGANAVVDGGAAAYLSFAVKGGPTQDNHFRNHDYQELLFHFSPENTTASPNGTWDFSQQAFHLGGEWVFRQPVPPYEDADDGFLGWPDEAPAYWFGGEVSQQRRVSIGNTTYKVDYLGALAQATGDYQGAHVYSRLNIVDADGAERRNFLIGDAVHIKNDFSALFGMLGALRTGTDVTVTDIEVRTSVYTPERAWAGKPTAVFEEAASAVEALGHFRWLFALDITGNGIQDILAVNSDGLLYALDGRDGSKLWVYDEWGTFRAAALLDVTGDAHPDLVVGTSLNEVIAFDTRLHVPVEERRLFSTSILSAQDALTGVAPYRVQEIVDLTQGRAVIGEPVLGVAVSASSGASWVKLLTVQANGTGRAFAELARHSTVTNAANPDVRLLDLARVRTPQGDHLAVSSMNGTVTLLALPGLQPRWLTTIPFAPVGLTVADLDQDGWEDLIVNTGGAAIGDPSGTHVYAISGRTGNLGPGLRQVLLNLNPLQPKTKLPHEAVLRGDGALVVTMGEKQLLVHSQGLIGWRYTPAQRFCGDLAGGTQSWTGLDVAPDDTLYMVSTAGAIMRATTSCPDRSLLFESVHPALSLPGVSFVALHATGDSFYMLSTQGDVYTRAGDGTATKVAAACSPAGQFLCLAPQNVLRWRVVEDAGGTAVAFFAAVSTAMGIRVVSYDLTSGAWSDHGTGGHFDFGDMYRKADGTLYLVGAVEDSPLALRRDPGTSSWQKERFFYGNTTGEPGLKILDLLFDSAGAGWAVDDTGQAWRSTVPGFWVPYATAGFSEPSGYAVLLEDPDGIVWVFGDLMEHFPLTTYVRSGEARLATTYDVDKALLDAGYTDLVVRSEEGHTGGTDAGKRSTTDVRWWFRYSATSPWILMDRDDKPRGDGFHSVLHSARLDCGLHPCGKIEFKTVLKTRTLDAGSDGVRQDAGMSPALLGGEIGQLRPDIAGAPIDIQIGAVFDVPDLVPVADGTEVSAFHGGLRLKAEPPLWAYLGIPYTGSPLAEGDNTRIVRASTGALVPDGEGPDVVITERGWFDDEWGGAFVQFWAVDGATGNPLRPATGEFFRAPGANYVDDVLIGDLSGDGVENVALIGYFNDEAWGAPEDNMVHVWDTAADTFHYIPVEEDKIATAAVLTGPAKGRQTLTFARSILISNDTVSLPQESNEIQSWFGPHASGTPGPELRWMTMPLGSQGHTTFAYIIPRHAMYGTAVVVSELVFVIGIDGTQVTQTARLVSWFDIMPPGQTRAVPPFYNVEVVAWFPGG
jgi:hypothetical protein